MVRCIFFNHLTQIKCTFNTEPNIKVNEKYRYIKGLKMHNGNYRHLVNTTKHQQIYSAIVNFNNNGLPLLNEVGIGKI